MSEMKKPPKIYLINWIDSCSQSGWATSEDCKADLSYCQSVGFLVEENKEAYCLALNRTTKEGHRPFGELITIPKVAVKSVKAIK
jgi:hypothetical protein